MSLKEILFVLVLFSSTLRADFPVAGVDPLRLEAYFAGPEILTQLSFAASDCRGDYFACGSQSELLYRNQNGVTDDGRIATLWAGRWFYEPFSIRIGQRVWAETIYVELWTGVGPYTDYTGASMTVHGVNWWNFVDQVLEYVSDNKKGKFELTAPGFYGVHFSDYSTTMQSAAPASISLIAIVSRVPGAEIGDVELTFSVEAK